MAHKSYKSKKVLKDLLKGAIKKEESGDKRTPLTAIIVACFLDRLNFVEFLNEHLKWDSRQWRVSPGNLAKAIVLVPFLNNGPRIAIQAINEQFEPLDMSLLFNDEVKSEWLTRDAFATMLDRFYDAGCEFLFTNIALRTYSAFNIPFEAVFHGDTTSISLYGEYETDEEDESLPKICRGVSKDGKRNLKQIMVGLITDSLGIPLHATVRDGSQNDAKWNCAVIDSLKDLLNNSKSKLMYIADSKLATGPNIKKLMEANSFFVTRCPASFEKKVAQKVTNEAYISGDWKDIGAYRESKKGELTTYEAQEFQKEICGKICRLLVLRSGDRQKKVEKVLEKKKDEAKSTIRESITKKFSCEADAKKEIELLKSKLNKSLWTVDFALKTEEVVVEKRTRGRPPKNAPPAKKEILWLIEMGEMTIIKDKYEALVRKTESFVLFTNVTYEHASTVEILRLYKGQKTVEDNFSVLKKPAMVDTLFLKLPRRITALVTILSFALLVQVIICVLFRSNLDTMEEKPGLDYNGKTLERVGLKKIMHFLGYYTVISRPDGIDYECRTDVHEPHIVTWLKLLEIDSLEI